MIDISQIDSNTLALAQQLQDVREGYVALKALTHALVVYGSGLLGLIGAGVALAVKYRHLFMNSHAAEAVLETLEKAADEEKRTPNAEGKAP